MRERSGGGAGEGKFSMVNLERRDPSGDGEGRNGQTNSNPALCETTTSNCGILANKSPMTIPSDVTRSGQSRDGE
jgi:hypothetical protein